ncbi:unnamed protein product [Gongylonema pulchrum]|uniref:PPM-type phosphatase domain-containing protein n=1 Tax=Gongylonema pulchrum TaxID=637853 RepID=A0A183E8X2_9BILA|nr:unnamed protein product [Gongylonema pulchrum]
MGVQMPLWKQDLGQYEERGSYFTFVTHFCFVTAVQDAYCHERSSALQPGDAAGMLLRRARDRLWSQLRRHSRASRANADAQLRSSEQACVVSEGAITRIDIAHLPANQPTEDFYATAKCLSSDAFLFGVFDGHCGNACSRYISTHLFDYVSAGALKRHIIMDLPLKDRLQWLYTNGDPLDEKFRCNSWFISV